jgi:hypothetical protein
MPRPNTKRPDCVIDGSQDPTVMRCKHCGGTEPLALPMALNDVVKLTKVFEEAHGLCHMSLVALRSRLDVLWDLPAPKSYAIRDRRAAEMTLVKRAIFMREEQNKKKRLKS